MMLTLIISVSPAQPPLDEGAAASLASTPPGPSPETLGAIDRLLHVQRFTLRSPYVYEWSAEGLEVRDGIVFVIAVDPLVSRPLQTGSAVLYMGGRPAEIVNGDSETGVVIAIAPGEVDLSALPIFYGSTVLPERVDAARGALELAAARSLGAAPVGAAELATARSVGGELLTADDRDALYRGLAELVAVYSPGEQDLIRALRLVP